DRLPRALQVAGRVLDPAQSFLDRDRPGRHLDHHAADAVAKLPAISGFADRDRAEDADLLGRPVSAGLEPVVEALRDHRQDGVVHRALVALLERLEPGQRQLQAAACALWSDGAVPEELAVLGDHRSAQPIPAPPGLPPGSPEAAESDSPAGPGERIPEEAPG